MLCKIGSRFGLSASADEEAKKKARISRFGSDTKTDSTKTDSKKTDSTKTDSLEEEKRKARALRSWFFAILIFYLNVILLA